MYNSLPNLRQAQFDQVLQILAEGQCCAIYGLSNTGKTLLLRALAQPACRPAYEALAGGPGVLVYVDCNRVVELSATGFYEIVLRSLIETLETLAPDNLLETLQEQHHRITAATTTFQASLAFNHALAETCQDLGKDFCLLLDEFDEIYSTLENRTLLNLRALKDNSTNRLTYLTATERPLNDGRYLEDNEFAELFVAHILPLGLLPPEDARQLLLASGGEALAPAMQAEVLQLGQGHMGLIKALTTAATRRGGQLATDASARAECLKIWNQLQPEEQGALMNMITDPEGGMPVPIQERLQAFGVLRADGTWFSSLFENFVRRQATLPADAMVGVMVDEDAGEVWVDGIKVMALTDLEYRLIRLLYQRRDRLTTKDLIVNAVWGNEQFTRGVDDLRIEKLVSRVRAKIEPDPAHPRYLLTQRGRGYKLCSQPSSEKDDDE